MALLAHAAVPVCLLASHGGDAGGIASPTTRPVADLEHLWGWGAWLHGPQWRPQGDRRPHGPVGPPDALGCDNGPWLAGPCATPAPRRGACASAKHLQGRGLALGAGHRRAPSSPQPCITAGRLQRVAIDREMARRGAAATPATRRAVRLARCAVPRSAKLHYGSPVGARLLVRDFRGFFAGVYPRDQRMWPIGPDSRDYEETTFCSKELSFLFPAPQGRFPRHVSCFPQVLSISVSRLQKRNGYS